MELFFDSNELWGGVGGKNMEKLVKYNANHIKGISTHSLKSDLDHISVVCSHSLIFVSDFSYV